MTATPMISTWMETTSVSVHLRLNQYDNNFTIPFFLGYNSKSLENMNDSDDMDVDVSPMSSKSIKSGIERMLEHGRELQQMIIRLEKKYQNVNDEIIAQNQKMMEVKIFDLMKWDKFIDRKNNFVYF